MCFIVSTLEQIVQHCRAYPLIHFDHFSGQKFIEILIEIQPRNAWQWPRPTVSAPALFLPEFQKVDETIRELVGFRSWRG